MGIKLKRNKIIRITITIFTIILLSVINTTFFWQISNQSVIKYNDKVEKPNVLHSNLAQIYEGLSVLWINLACEGDYQPYVEQFVDVTELKQAQKNMVTARFNVIYREMASDFNANREHIDYYVKYVNYESRNSASSVQWNGKNDLSVFATADYESEELVLESQYRNLWVMKFDNSGQLTVDVIKSDDTLPENIEEELQKLYKEDAHMEKLLNYEYTNHINRKVSGESFLKGKIKPIKNLTIVYGIPNNSLFSITEGNELSKSTVFRSIQMGAMPTFLLSMICMFILAYIMTNPKVWKDLPFQKKRKQYLLETGVVGLLLIKIFYNVYCFGLFQVQHNDLNNLEYYMNNYAIYFRNHDYTALIWYGSIIGICCVIFSYMYVTFSAICPIFFTGIRSYVKQYSYTYKRISDIKAYIEHIKRTLETFDLKRKGSGMILKLVFVHTLIIVALCCLGAGGILVAFGYTAVVFFIINHYYKELAHDYKNLIEITNYIADGNFDIEMKKKFGLFQQAKDGLERIQSGFKKAVEEEVKSQRMKTELITNVSHDLKTPLTAITTYVELLKDEDLTQEEQKIYIETLEQKSMRMKVLIEDLFELSKASSNDMVLDLMQVDLVNLMKQVCIEHCETYEEMGLKLCWNVPEEKVELMLDSQRTYRIFENLFVNIEKYAMPNSRVYIDVMQSEESVVVTIKNMSAEELNVEPEELTERFVRGDASRNTEGSGLGLAIAKNLIELQNGTLKIAVDGDLFKTIIRWKKNKQIE